MNPDSAQDIEDIYPLSGMQQLLLMHALRPDRQDSGFLHYRCTLHGELDVETLRTAWTTVVARSDSLRSNFAWDGLDEPLQVVHRTVDVPWSLLDWSADDPAEQAARLEELLKDDRARGFDLGAVPLIRLALIRLESRRHVMLWSHHHIQTDGWSVAVIIREVIGLYVALRQGTTPALPPRRPFRDYIAWLMERDQDAAQRYWSDLLRGFTAPTRLAREAVGQAHASGEPGMESVSRACPTAVLRALEQRASSCHVTVNTMISAAWALVLGRACASADVVFGSTVSGRPPGLDGFESMVGTFINNLPVRIAIQPEQQVTDWLAGIFRQQLASQEFDYPPLFRLEEWSGIPARHRLFDSLVLFDNAPDTSATSCGADLRIGDTNGSTTSSFPCTLIVRSREQLEMEAIVDRTRLSGYEAARLLDHLAVVLTGLADKQAAVVARLNELLDESIAGGAPVAAGATAGATAEAAVASAIVATEQPAHRSPYIPLHSQLLGIWGALLGISDIAITDNFFALGGHSLLAARMLAEAGRQLGRPVPMTLLFEGPTIEKLAAALLREFSTQHRSVIELTPDNGDPPFFFLHGDLVGGGYYTVALARQLGPQLPFQVISPLPVDRGQVPPSIAEMAQEHVKQIRTVRPHGPYRLGGYCNGGVVMFEAACQLIQAGERIDFLGLIDVTVGQLPLRYISHAIELAAMPLGLSIDQQLRAFAYVDNRLERLLNPSELRKAVRGLCTRWWSPRPEPLSAATEDQDGDRLLRAYQWALARYRPQRFAGALTLYMADNGGDRQRDHRQDWAEFAERVEVRTLPGHHFDIITHQAGHLAAALLQDMNRSAKAEPVR